MKEKITINTAIWGKKYIDDFLKITFEFIIRELEHDKHFYNKYEIILEIWTLKNNFKDFKFLKKKQLFKTNLIEIDLLTNNYSSYFNNNKYLFLNIIQNLSLTRNYHHSNYIIFIYADFIWEIGSLKNIIKKIKNKMAVCIYCPQTIEENFKKNIIFEKISDFIINNLHPIITNHSFNKDMKFTTAASLNFVDKNFLVFRNFHLHPICLRLNNTKILKKFFISLDEDFINNNEVFNRGNIYIPKKSEEIIFSSLLTKTFKTGLTTPYSFKSIISWVTHHCSALNVKFFENVFFFSRSNCKSLKLSKFIKNTKKIINISNINLSNNNKFNIRSLNKINSKIYLFKFMNFKKMVLDNSINIANDKYYYLHNHIIFNKPKEITLKKNDLLLKFLFKNIYYSFLKKNKNKNNKIKFK